MAQSFIYFLEKYHTSLYLSPDVAKQIMKIQDLQFATRPQSSFGEIIMYNHSDIGTCPYGDYWRNMRKVCIVELLSTKMVKSFDSIRQAEMSSLISSINSMPDSLINLSDKIFWFTSSVTSRSAFGKIVHGQDTLMMLMKDITLLAGGLDLTDLFPSRKWLHGICELNSKILKVHKQVDAILENIINEHWKNRAIGKKRNSESGGEDLIDVLLRVMESGELGTPITNKNIKAVIFVSFVSYKTSHSFSLLFFFLKKVLIHNIGMLKIKYILIFLVIYRTCS